MTQVVLNRHEDEARAYYDNVKQARDAMKPKFDALTGQQKLSALQRLANWNFGTATDNENALYVAVTLLYVVTFFIVARIRRNA